jgi:uncharacterized protein (TIGR02757 family)
LNNSIVELLNAAANQYNRPEFILDDPISVPHLFTTIQDREIIGFWTAVLAWGQRKTIIQSASKLIQLMDGAPYDFIQNHEEKDRARFLEFKHRTFQAIDTLYFLEFFQYYYKKNNSLESAFSRHLHSNDLTTERALSGFHEEFFSLPFAPDRTKKHVPTPARNSTCKRLNMFLRWMVRNDDRGVDFGLWDTIKASQLLIPLDVHVEKIARKLGLLKRPQTDWRAVLELTEQLRFLDPHDPTRFDFALFGLGKLESSLLLPKEKLIND